MIALLLLFVKSIFGVIDSMVVFVIKYLYQLIIAIADTNVFGNVIYHYLGRIYTFLGIFMVFKLSISMINYIINPDALTDKSKGFGKLISNVIISLILLVATPTLFNVAFDIQADILNSNALYQIVTGKKTTVEGQTDAENAATMYKNAEINAQMIAYGVYSPFIYQKTNDDNVNYYEDENNRKVVTAVCESGTTGCIDKKCQYGSTTCLLDNKTITNDSNTYWWLLSTIVGVAVAYILLTFCFDVAVRSVKLGFLQIIAPIPIMMRMDPGAKDDKFSKWLKEVGSTFASLFVRLAGLYFVIEIINLVMNPDPKLGMFSKYSGYTGESGLTALFVKLFIIIGCLMFAKKLPQLISDLFGIKLDGDGFSLKKKMGNIPGLGAAKVLGAGALGFAGGAAANAWATGRNIKNMGLRKALTGNDAGSPLGLKDFTRGARTLFSDVGGGISGAYRGATSKEKNMFKAAGAGISGAAAARNLRRERTDLDADGIKGWASRTGASISNLAGIESGATGLDKMSASLSDVGSKKKEIDNYISSLKSVDDANKALATANAIGDAAGIQTAIANLKAAKDAAWNNTNDSALQALVNNYNVSVEKANKLNPDANITVIGDRSDPNVTRGTLDDSAKQASDANIILQASDEWAKAHTGVKNSKN